MTDEITDRIKSVLDDYCGPETGLHRMTPYLAERIARAIAQPEPFPEKDAPHVFVTARWQCPCAAGDVLLQNIMLPFDIDEKAFQWAMRQWWIELKHEARAHLNEPKKPDA